MGDTARPVPQLSDPCTAGTTAAAAVGDCYVYTIQPAKKKIKGRYFWSVKEKKNRLEKRD